MLRRRLLLGGLLLAVIGLAVGTCVLAPTEARAPSEPPVARTRSVLRTVFRIWLRVS